MSRSLAFSLLGLLVKLDIRSRIGSTPPYMEKAKLHDFGLAGLWLHMIDYERIWKNIWGDMQKYGPVHRHHRRIFGHMIAMVPKEDVQSVADIGCGEGSNLLYLGSVFQNAKLIGFDLSKTAIDKAKLHVNGTFFVLDIEKERLSERYDFIICSDVIEHILDDVTTLKNIHCATRKYALIATVQGQMREFEKTIGHVRSYGLGELQKKLESVGFTVIQSVEWGFPLYSPLYRNLFDRTPAEKVSHGHYGLGKRFLCFLLYILFFLNSHKKGDIIFMLVKV